MIKASELAAILGRNPYKLQSEAVCEVLTRARHGRAAESELRGKHALPEVSAKDALSIARDVGVRLPVSVQMTVQQEESARSVAKHAKESLKRVKTQKEVDPVELASAEGACEEAVRAVKQAEAATRDAILHTEGQVKASLTRHVEQQAKEVAQQTRARVEVPEALSSLATQHTRMALGTRDEASILDRARSECEALKDAEPSARDHRSAMIGELDDGTTVVLHGVCDGYVLLAGKRSECDVMIEIKRRQNRLFRCLPDYEYVQLCAYMEMYDARRGVLVESFDGEICLHWRDRNRDEWVDMCASVVQVLSHCLANDKNGAELTKVI